MKILITGIGNKTTEVITTMNTYKPECQISIAGTGKECLDIIKNGECFDAVLLGMELTDISGLELLEQFREYSDIPVIVLPEKKDPLVLVRAFDAGASDYLEKPLNVEILFARKSIDKKKKWDIRQEKQKLKAACNGNGGDAY
jgi:two-component system KDP operon response regulator KdpE